MRATSAFFAGVGTVAVAIGAGLGGGLLLGEIMSPQQPKYPSSEVTRLEQRGSPQIQAANGASQPVPYLPSTQAAATVAEPQSQPQQPQSQPQQQAQPPAQQASAKPAEPKQAEPNVNTKSEPPAAAPQPLASTEPPAARDRAAPEDANARARDADLKRDGRRADDRRKAERRQQWAERRKWRRDGDDDLSDVEASVRQATESRSRSFFGRDEPRFSRDEQRPMFGGGQGFGRLRIFESDD